MSDTPLSQETVDSIFSQLSADDVDQFYRGYQRWRFQQRLDELREQLDALQQRMAVNREAIQQNAPSAMALASLARLQSHGVENTDLLDRLLDRGDEWLDRTIQRLEYCEQTGLIGDDYTKWCEHALEGAYDWIDSLTGVNGAAPATQPTAAAEGEQEEIAASETLPQTTEAMLLQKLMSEEEEATTLKLPVVPATPVLAESAPAELADAPAEQIMPAEPDLPASHEPETLLEDEPIQTTSAAQQTSKAEVAPPEVSATALTGSASESEQTVVSDESSGPGDAAQTIIPDEISEQDNPARADGVQEPAPSEQYAFPESFDEFTPAEAKSSLSPANSQPLVEPPVVSSNAVVSRAPQQANAPAARPPRKRNFWQKLVYVLLGK